jgi:uncharacterized protein (DUF2267 family)
MPTTGLRQLDSSIHQTNEWLSQLALKLGVRDKRAAYTALRAVLHALRSELSPGASAQLAAELPIPIRGLYFEGWDPNADGSEHDEPGRLGKLVGRELGEAVALTPEQVLEATFSMLATRVTRRVSRSIHDQLPKNLRQLWPVADSTAKWEVTGVQRRDADGTEHEKYRSSASSKP